MRGVSPHGGTVSRCVTARENNAHRYGAVAADDTALCCVEYDPAVFWKTKEGGEEEKLDTSCVKAKLDDDTLLVPRLKLHRLLAGKVIFALVCVSDTRLFCSWQHSL